MKINFFFLAFLPWVILSCNLTSSTRKTPSGMEYSVLREGDGIKPKVGQIVVFNYLVKDSKDSIWYNTYDVGLPQRIQIADSSMLSTEDGIIQMLRLSSKGDSTTLQLPVTSFFKDFVRSPIPPMVDSLLTIKFHIALEDIVDKENFEEYWNGKMQAYQAKMEQKMLGQLAKDTVIIDEYLAGKGIKALTTPGGVRYVITQEGKGEFGTPGKTAEVNYVGYLLDGTFFDSSIRTEAEKLNKYDPRREPYEPLKVTIGQGQVIQGWEEAIQVLKIGGKGTFYIPSSLAYGPQQRSEVIKANSILVFDMELIDLK